MAAGSTWREAEVGRRDDTGQEDTWGDSVLTQTSFWVGGFTSEHTSKHESVHHMKLLFQL